jgi:hypothetical protein
MIDQFLDYILSEMSAAEFAAALRLTTLPRDEQVRLARLAWERETEAIYQHVMYPNEA